MSERTLGGRRVLVVEDEWVTADDLCGQIRGEGAQVVGPVATVAQALGAIEGGPPDAAILDINLGGEMAFRVADALRARGIPFLFATGYDAWSIPEGYRDVTRLEKPFDVSRCLRMLWRELEAG